MVKFCAMNIGSLIWTPCACVRLYCLTFGRISHDWNRRRFVCGRLPAATHPASKYCRLSAIRAQPILLVFYAIAENVCGNNNIIT